MMKKYLSLTVYILCAIGLVLCFWAVGLADEYIIELSQDPPRYVWRLLTGGVLLMLPAFVRMIKSEAKCWEWDWN